MRASERLQPRPDQDYDASGTNQETTRSLHKHLNQTLKKYYSYFHIGTFKPSIAMPMGIVGIVAFDSIEM